MQHPKDVKGSDKPKSLLSIPVGQRYTTILGRFDALDIKVRHLEDRAQTQRDESSHSEAESKVLEYRLGRIESEIKVMHHVVGKNILALDEIEKRIAIMQEKIDGID